MKRFVFRLEVLLRFKRSTEKEQKARLMEIQERLRRLQEEMSALLAERAALSERYNDETSHGVSAERLAVFGNYFEHLREAIERQAERIAQAEQEKAERQAQLIRTMKEVKALNKLREAQYAEYLAEVAREEEKAIGDIVSFKVTTGAS